MVARFGRAFHGNALYRLIADIGRFNDLTERIWRGDVERRWATSRRR